MDRGAWWAAVHGVAKSWTRLSDFTFISHFHALEKEMATPPVCLENPRDGGAWWATVYGVAQSRTLLKQLSSSSSSNSRTIKRGLGPVQSIYFPKLGDLPDHTCAEKAPWRTKESYVKDCSTQMPFQ